MADRLRRRPLPPLSSNHATSNLIYITKEPSSGWHKVTTIFGNTGQAILLTGVVRANTRKQIQTVRLIISEPVISGVILINLRICIF